MEIRFNLWVNVLQQTRSEVFQTKKAELLSFS